MTCIHCTCILCASIYEEYGSDEVILGYNLELNCHIHENGIYLCIPLCIFLSWDDGLKRTIKPSLAKNERSFEGLIPNVAFPFTGYCSF